MSLQSEAYPSLLPPIILTKTNSIVHNPEILQITKSHFPRWQIGGSELRLRASNHRNLHSQQQQQQERRR